MRMTDAPVDSTKDWQCAVLSFAAHAFFLSVAVFCMPLFALHQNDLPKEEIIMVTMESLPIECSMGSASDAGAQSMDFRCSSPGSSSRSSP